MVLRSPVSGLIYSFVVYTSPTVSKNLSSVDAVFTPVEVLVAVCAVPVDVAAVLIARLPSSKGVVWFVTNLGMYPPAGEAAGTGGATELGGGVYVEDVCCP